MTAPEPSPPHLSVAHGVATVTLNRPDVRNSLSDEDLHTLQAHAHTIEHDTSIRLAVLQARVADGPRPVFCAGYRLQGLAEGASAPRRFEQAVQAWAELRVPTVALINGSVHGGGTDLALACDLRLSLPNGEWRMPACRMGLLFYPEGLRRYARHLGPDWSKRAFLLGQPLPVAVLASLGVVESLDTPEAMTSRLQAISAEVLAMAPLAVEATKRHLNALTWDRWHAESYAQDEHLIHQSADLAEGRDALMAGRRPQFERR